MGSFYLNPKSIFSMGFSYIRTHQRIETYIELFAGLSSQPTRETLDCLTKIFG